MVSVGFPLEKKKVNKMAEVCLGTFCFSIRSPVSLAKLGPPPGSGKTSMALRPRCRLTRDRRRYREWTGDGQNPPSPLVVACFMTFRFHTWPTSDDVSADIVLPFCFPVAMVSSHVL